MSKIDPYTGEMFVPKKISQRFANKENRIKYNNEIAKKIRIEQAGIINPLKLNVKIIKGLLGIKHQVIVHKEFLRGKGFDFTISSGNDRYEGKIYPLIFNYLIINDYNINEVKILLWD